ncbi:MAG: IS3 family transposase [Chloroflexi bacterium]|nr:IS3 family transposase [Chloroflexota bacterium]
MSRYRFIAEERRVYPLRRLCAVLKVSVSGFYDWLKRTPSRRAQANHGLSARIRAVHEASRQTYGTLRVQAELRAHGERAGKHRIARLMRQMGLQTKGRRRFKTTTQRDATHRRAPNLLAGDFTAKQSNEKWLSDITYIATREGWLYLAGIQDVFSRRIVGWAMSDRPTKTLVCDAWRLAVGRRGAPRLHHSDQGSQYTSDDYLRLLENDQVTLSMSDVGRCYDNAMQESFWGTLKTECADRPFPTRAAARKAIFEYIEVWYNRQRRHSALGYLSPADFEQLACP